MTAAASDKDGAANLHTRTYQACIPCRRRKVRCDLGPVDSPHEPPCVRCRREAKECFFSATRRKKRDGESSADLVDPDDIEIRGGRKRLRGDTDSGNDIAEWDSRAAVSPSYLSQPLTPGGSLGRRQPLRRPAHSQTPFRDDEDDEHVNSQTAALLQTAELHSGHDALNVLIEAATHHRAGSTSDAKASGSFDRYGTIPTSSPVVTTKAPRLEQRPSFHHRTSQNEPVIDPSIMQNPAMEASADENISAFNAWARFRFVRNGWFTVAEGMQYLEYFYTFLSPLTPIAVPDYRHPSRHAELLETEPMLAVTILMITSRYMALQGSGALGRSYAIHSRLWPYTQRMIDRLAWGRDHSGCGVSSAETQPGCDVSPLQRTSSLALGTVESLMLLTEWHSRLMHFPADEDDALLMAPKETHFGSAGQSSPTAKPVGSWIEPCYRSDRMCWMLLGMAMSVAFQIGVFDEDPSRHSQGMTKDQAASYNHRKSHVKALLLVYVTQTSGRLGITAMLPQGYARPNLSEFWNLHSGAIKDTRDVVIHFWLRLAAFVKQANEDLYANRQHTRKIIRDGSYVTLLQGIQPVLAQWRKDLDARQDIPMLMRHILHIEHEHSNVMLYQLALQAVLERCINNNTTQQQSDKPIAPQVLEQWYGNDRQYVKLLMHSCRNVLRIVVDGLAPGGYLKHAPVRTFFRIVSMTMVLVKAFAFGAFEDEMAVSLGLMDRTVEALSTCVVDDVHLANRFGELIGTLSSRTRAACVRMGKGGNGNSRGVSQSPAPQSTYVSHMSEQQSYSKGGGGAPANQQQWPFNPAPPSALYGISTQTYDFSDNGNTFSVMPPPTNPASPNLGHASLPGNFGGNNFGSGFGSNGFGDYNGDMPDWLALPLDPLLQSNGQDVTQTGFGPGIGDYDMLDVLLGANSI
ncbi:hypothetical protein MBLNU459_g1580t1 [Dothideomycetes sp. NU459]